MGSSSPFRSDPPVVWVIPLGNPETSTSENHSTVRKCLWLLELKEVVHQLLINHLGCCLYTKNNAERPDQVRLLVQIKLVRLRLVYIINQFTHERKALRDLCSCVVFKFWLNLRNLFSFSARHENYFRRKVIWFLQK